MARTPTQLVSEHLTGDPAMLRDARERLTLAETPAAVRERIACALRRSERRGYAAIHNERMIRTHPRLGALRRGLVQWAAHYAPRGRLSRAAGVGARAGGLVGGDSIRFAVGATEHEKKD